MRVLLVTDWPGAGGGVETYVGLVARGLRDAGDDVRLLTSDVGDGAKVADFTAYGSNNPLVQSVLQVTNPAAASTMRRALRDFAPDVVHVSMFEMHLSPSVLAAARDVPTILSIAYYKPICPNGLKLLPDNSRCVATQGMVCWRGGCTPLLHWIRDRVRYARIGTGVRGAAAIVACSIWLQQELSFAGIASEWIPWPIARPGEDFRRAPAMEPMFVYVGRLAREKGVSTLLHALAIARQQGLDARARLVGDGPLRSQLEREAADLGLDGIVEFTGWLDDHDVESALVDAWALVAPSLWAEPLGLTALDAIARRIPVIASATGGLAESVEPGITGLLFPNGDAAALAECLRAITAGTGTLRDVSQDAADRFMQKHDLDRHVAHLRALFATVAA